MRDNCLEGYHRDSTESCEQREERIRRLSEGYPCPERPYLRDTQAEESWGRLVYTISAI